MLRRLLTLLAVFSGFTLAAEPVRAAEADLVSMVQAAEEVDCVVEGVAPPRLLAGPAPRIALPQRLRAAAVICAPTVYLQADRARE